MDGQVWRGYADLEEAIIDRFLHLAENEGAAFELEQTLSLREYIRRKPGAKARFRKLAKRGQFALIGSGEAIIDANQCHGEVLIRNLASGMHYAERELGITPIMGGHHDGFGSSAQMPQIFRQAGLRWIAGLAYSKPDAPYWRGLDGSTVFGEGDVLTGPMGTGDYFYDHCYYTPCRTCKGTGMVGKKKCPDCRGYGIEMKDGVYPPRAPFAPNLKNGYATYIVRSEEMLADDTLPDWVRAENRKSTKYAFEWATHPTIIERHWKEALARCDEVAPDEISSRVENNPTQTGCLVSRMRGRLATRRAERALLAAERFLGMMALHGHPVDASALEPAWLNLPILFFHDAITGTHIDPAHDEIMDMAHETIAVSRQVAVGNGVKWSGLVDSPKTLRPGQSLWAFNPSDRSATVDIEWKGASPSKALAVVDAHGVSRALRPKVPVQDLNQPDLIALHPDSRIRLDREMPYCSLLGESPALDGTPAKLRAATPPKVIRKKEVDNGLLRLTWDQQGLTSVVDVKSGRTLTVTKKGQRPNQLILEHDIGDPWGTRDFHRPRRPLDGDTKFISATRHEGCVEILFAGAFMINRRFAREADPSVFGLEWTQTIRLWDGVNRVDFVTEIYWKSAHRRIRVAFPTPSRSDTGVYGIPAGWLERPRYEMTDNRLYSPNGDWPAIDFFATRPTGRAPGTALYNKGTSSSRIEDGVMMMSLLRSPAFGHCLERFAQDYPMPMYHLRDPGYHCFEYALAPIEGGEGINRTATAAEAYNWSCPLMGVRGRVSGLGGLNWDDEALTILAIKPSFDGHDWILRTLNRSDRTVQGRLILPKAVAQVRAATLLEKSESTLKIEEKSVEVAFKPWEIRTFRLKVN